MNRKRIYLVVLALLLMLIIVTVSLVSAREDQPSRAENVSEAAAGSAYIPIQGRLTDSSGNPLTGDYPITFRFYGALSGGTALCQDSTIVKVDQGLFSTYMLASSCPIDGRTLYLGVEVGSDGEMSPRQYVDNVPYAWSLRPGAKVEANTLNPILSLNNLGNGPGLYAESSGGAAIEANGRIISTEPTYLWISGNGVRPFHHDDSTIIDMNNTGGATIYRGATVGTKNVMLPITIPGTLYGQNVRITDLDLYWVGATEFDGITAVLMRRQTGVCSTAPCYEDLLYDATDYTCEIGVNSTGCDTHYDVTLNNVLSADSGMLYLTIEFFFSGESTAIDFGGARLTLEYND